MEFITILVFASIYCASGRVVNHHALGEERNRFIYMPNDKGFPVLVDLLEDLDQNVRVKNSDVRYYLFTRKNPFRPFEIFNGPISQLSTSNFDPKKPILVAIHGWLASNASEINKYIRVAALESHDLNLIIVDWSEITQKTYGIAKISVTRVGEIVGDFISSLQKKYQIPGSHIRLVGHSLGAHVAGSAGARIIKINQQSVDHIVGLDPASPLYDINDTDNCLDPTDADFVLVIHTSTKILGISKPIGHSNYYPNGGMNQPGCDMNKLDQILGGCAHCRSYLYYSESLRRGEVFIGKKCKSFGDYVAGNCDNNEESPMGLFNVDKKARGIYYLKTNPTPPFGRN